jgi:hypothetical protein
MNRGLVHCLLLSCDGFIYVFEDNKCGKVGNATKHTQRLPKNLENEVICKLEPKSKTTVCNVIGKIESGNNNTVGLYLNRAITGYANREKQIFKLFN